MEQFTKHVAGWVDGQSAASIYGRLPQRFDARWSPHFVVLRRGPTTANLGLYHDLPTLTYSCPWHYIKNRNW